MALNRQDDMSQARALFKLNEKFFVGLGAWPLQSTYIRFTIWIVYLFIHLAMLYADLFHHFGDLQSVVLNLTETTYSTMIFFKMMVMRFSRTLESVMSRIIEGLDIIHYNSDKEVEMYLSYSRIAMISFKVWVLMGLMSTIVYYGKSLEYRIKDVFSNESQPFVLAHRTRLPFEIEDSSTFWCVWVYQCPMAYYAVFHVATIGYLFSLVLHVCGQMSVLTFRVRNIDAISRNGQVSSDKIFSMIVEKHRTILGLAQDINTVFGLLLLEELLITTLLMGLTSFNVLQSVNPEGTGMLVLSVLYGCTMLLVIYGYCVAGEYLITESNNLYQAYYECPWYNESESFKKQLVICMIGANKPIQLSAGGFYTFSVVNFTSILKTSAGYISMLRTMI